MFTKQPANSSMSSQHQCVCTLGISYETLPLLCMLPCLCHHAPAFLWRAVASDKIVRVNCTGPFTGPSFVVALSAESGDSDCKGTTTETATVTVNTRPTMTVELQAADDNEEFCETKDETTYTFTVTATNLGTGNEINLEIPTTNCKFASPAGLANPGSGENCDLVCVPAMLVPLCCAAARQRSYSLVPWMP